MEELLFLEGPALKFVAASHSQLAFQLTLVSEHLKNIRIFILFRELISYLVIGTFNSKIVDFFFKI